MEWAIRMRRKHFSFFLISLLISYLNVIRLGKASNQSHGYKRRESIDCGLTIVWSHYISVFCSIIVRTARELLLRSSRYS